MGWRWVTIRALRGRPCYARRVPRRSGDVFRRLEKKPTIPADAAFEHVYVRSVRVANDDYGNRHYEWRHTSKKRGLPMTYWEVAPNRNAGC